MAGRLKAMPSRLGAAPARLASIGSGPDRLRARDQNIEWRKWYKTARWQRLRWSVLERDMFICCRCGDLFGDTSLLVADHKTPHRGDPVLFWDADNLQCMCKTCHDRHKQREERRSAG